MDENPSVTGPNPGLWSTLLKWALARHKELNEKKLTIIKWILLNNWELIDGGIIHCCFCLFSSWLQLDLFKFFLCSFVENRDVYLFNLKRSFYMIMFSKVSSYFFNTVLDNAKCSNFHH